MDKLPRSKVDQFLEQQAADKKRSDITIENIQEYKLALNRMYATSEGKLVARYMLKFIGLYTDDPVLNPAGLIEEKGKKAYYLRMVRPHLDKKLRMEIENL